MTGVVVITGAGGTGLTVARRFGSGRTVQLAEPAHPADDGLRREARPGRKPRIGVEAAVVITGICPASRLWYPVACAGAAMAAMVAEAEVRGLELTGSAAAPSA